MKMDNNGNFAKSNNKIDTLSESTKGNNTEFVEQFSKERKKTNTELVKEKVENELLIKLGAKEEEFDWHPDILTRRSERPKSSVSLDYPLDIKVGSLRKGNTDLNRNPWLCNDQALRQMTLVSRHGPKLRYFNRPQYRPRNEINILKIS